LERRKREKGGGGGEPERRKGIYFFNPGGALKIRDNGLSEAGTER